MKDYSFMAFAVCMGTLILFVLGMVLYGAAIALKWMRAIACEESAPEALPTPVSESGRTQ